MKNIVKISIRLFIVFTIFKFINTITGSATNFLAWIKYNQALNGNFDKTELTKAYLPFILLWSVYIIIIILLWKKSEAISDKITGKKEQEKIDVSLNYEDFLSASMIVIAIYLFMDSIPGLFSYVSNLLISKTRFVDNDFIKEYTIKEIVGMTGIALKMLIAFVIIKNNRKIVKRIIMANSQ